jgi:PAS domain S-box-containing protein
VPVVVSGHESSPSADGVGPFATEDEVRAQLELYLSLVEHAPDAIVVLDVDEGRFVSVNPAAERLFGLPRQHLLTVGPVELSPPVQPDGRASAAAAAEYIARAVAGEQPRFGWTHRRADESTVACEMTLLGLPSTGGARVRASIVDISDRLEAVSARRDADDAQAGQSAAEAVAARMQAMVAGLNAIVWECDAATWRLRYINAQAEELLGYSLAEWLTDEPLWTSIIEPADQERVLRAVTDGIAAGGDFTVDYRVRARDGRRVWLQQLGHVVRGVRGGATVHAVLIDITEHKRREQASRLLVAAAGVLAAPDTAEQRLTALTGLLVGELCDGATIWLRGDDERYRAVAAAPAGLAERVLDLPSWRLPDELRSRLRPGRAFVTPDVTGQLLRGAAVDVEHYDAVAGPGGTEWVAAALTTGDVDVGLLTLTVGPGTRFDEAFLSLVADLAQLVATMVAAERLVAQRRHLHQLAAALSAAGTVAEAAEAVSTGLRAILDAEVVSLCTVDADGLLHAVEVAGYLPDRLPQFAAMRLSAELPLTDAARTRRSVWLRDRAATVARYPLVEPALLPTTEALAALPLLAGDLLVGALGVSFDRPRPFDTDERDFLQAVAGLVAVAFDRAALADARREMAETLQRSLLPVSLPTVEGVAVTARYLPAVEGTRAGGDWYDVLPVDDGRVAVAVGDVVGHGARAAAVMGQLRSALATLLLAGFTPARALEHLDRFAEQVPGAAVCTVACLVLDTATGRITYSSAGHPPPLLLLNAEGHEQLDGGRGPALGVATAARRPEATATIPAGATLLLYTDGLVERRRDTLDAGQERLAAAAARLRSAPLPTLVDGVLADLDEENGFGDDVAVVAVRLLPAPLRLGVRADPALLSSIRRTVGQWATTAGLDGDSIEDLQLALGEATGNAVEHAYRDAATPSRVQIELDFDDDGTLRVRVTDTGSWRPEPADPGHRGRGLQIISALGRDVVLDAGPSGTVVRFRFVPASGPGAVEGTVTAPPLPGEEPATLSISERNGRRHLAVAGDLDLTGVTALQDTLRDELDGAARLPLTVDLTGVGWLASVGIGLLLTVAGRAGPDTEFVLPPRGPARHVLDLTGVAAAIRLASTPACP